MSKTAKLGWGCIILGVVSGVLLSSNESDSEVISDGDDPFVKNLIAEEQED